MLEGKIVYQSTASQIPLPCVGMNTPVEIFALMGFYKA